MTNHEASCVLHCPDAYGGIYGQKYGEALAHCFELLKQQPCEDAVSRQAVLDACDQSINIFDATDRIKELPSVQPKVKECEDCISREAAIKVFGDVHPMDYNTQAYITNIQNLPSVTPNSTRGRGHWSRKTKVDAYDIAGVKTWGIKCQCDKCDFTTIVVEDFGYYKYCPNCGCRMIESEEV